MSSLLPVGLVLGETAANVALPGSGTAIAAASAVAGANSNSNSSGTAKKSWLAGQIESLFDTEDLVARFVTGLLGVLLVAAAIFTHPAVVQNVTKAGKSAVLGSTRLTKAAAEAGILA